ncbi:MAG: PAS domain-containing protein [Thiolinea sp.]
MKIPALPMLAGEPALPEPLLSSAELAEHLPCVVVQTTLSGQITYLSQHWHSLTGHVPADCTGKPLSFYIDPDDHDRLKTLFSLSTSEPEHDLSVRCLCADHKARWIQLVAHRVSREQGGSGIVGIIHDISQRVGREATLLANQRTITGMLNDFQGMVYRCRNDPHWSMQYVSRGSLSLTGYRARDIINNTRLTYGSLIIDSDQKRVWHAVQRALQEKTSFDLIYHIRTAQGGIKRVWERGKGIFSGSNDLLGLEGFITDISLYQSDLYPALDAQAPALLMNQTAGQVIPQTFFLNQLATRHQLYLQDTSQPYAVLYLHLDNCRKHCEHLDLEQVQCCAREIIQRITPLLCPDDRISHELLHEVRILLQAFSGEQVLQNLALQLHDAFLEPLPLADADLYLTLSIGLALPAREQDNGMLVLAEAEEAMVRAHEIGGNRTCLAE